MSILYVVRTGDHLGRIARRFGIHRTALLCANPQIGDDQVVVPGEMLHIPENKRRMYAAGNGDTWKDIADRFGVGMEELLSANPDQEREEPLPGQQIAIPSRKGTAIHGSQTEYGYLELLEDIERFKAAYPFVQAEIIGYSVMGREIPALRIGTGLAELHYNGAVHANEWITSALLMRFAEDYAKAYLSGDCIFGCAVKELFEQTSLWIVPMVNPDGVELVLSGSAGMGPYRKRLLEWNQGEHNFRGWKANIRGVDLNDQFPAFWEEERQRRGKPGAGPRDYAGSSPLSEPEARALAEFTENRDFRLVIAFHTQGKEIYWNYREFEPPRSEELAAHFSRISGYRPVRLTGSDAGYKDWFIARFRRPGFTVEAGIGTNPLPIAQFAEIYGDLKEVMIEAIRAAAVL
ncbi:M14 family zinc carboxypeptidase [Ferviditalea candida]|uniref:M14 family zinc carboxypeptidase n=1 Tax=Ferviditalea candida TaxID=3108399 RepID=A0ABU5ZCS2_9BACL|nr:M14 family zinc carboxypeptidase [Paenibacillaceae bacterium T2]